MRNVLDVPIEAGSVLTLRGASGDEQRVTLGSWSNPNVEAILEYSLMDIDSIEGIAAPRVGELLASVTPGVLLSKESPGGYNNSYVLTNTDTVGIPYDDALAMTSGTGVSLSIKPEANSGTIIDYPASGQKIELLADGAIKYSATTNTGTYEAISAPVELNKWATVSAHCKDDEIILDINGKTVKTSITGDLINNVNTVSGDPDIKGIILGEGFAGKAHAFKLYNWSSPRLLAFDDGTDEKVFIIPESGTLDVQIFSLGNLGTASEIKTSVANKRTGGLVQNAFATTTNPFDKYLYKQVDVSIQSAIDNPETGYLTRCALKLLKKGTYLQRFASDIVWGFLTGQKTDTAGGTIGDLLSGMLLYGDIRDYAIQTYWLITEGPDGKNYNKVIYILSCLGMITNGLEMSAFAATIGTSWTGVGAVVGAGFTSFFAWADFVIAAAKQAFKIYKTLAPTFNMVLGVALEGLKKALWAKEAKLIIKYLNYLQFYIAIKTMPDEVKKFFADAIKNPSEVLLWMEYFYKYLTGPDAEEGGDQQALSCSVENAYAASLSPKVTKKCRDFARKIADYSKKNGIEPNCYTRALRGLKYIVNETGEGILTHWSSSRTTDELLNSLAKMVYLGSDKSMMKAFNPKHYDFQNYPGRKTGFFKQFHDLDLKILTDGLPPDQAKLLEKKLSDHLNKIATEHGNHFKIMDAKHSHMNIDSVTQAQAKGIKIIDFEKRVVIKIDNKEIKVRKIDQDRIYPDGSKRALEIKSAGSKYFDGNFDQAGLNNAVTSDLGSVNSKAELEADILCFIRPELLNGRIPLWEYSSPVKHFTYKGKTGSEAVIEKMANMMKENKNYYADKLNLPDADLTPTGWPKYVNRIKAQMIAKKFVMILD